MLTIKYGSHFKKDFKRALKRGCDPKKFEAVIKILASEKPLPPKCRNHSLSGNYAGFEECHITPDWLLIYKVDHDQLVLILTRTGSHSDLFR